MKEQILELKNQGLTIQQIANALNCSRANIAYHTDAKAKEKTLARIKRQRETKRASRPLKQPKIKAAKPKEVKVKKEAVKSSAKPGRPPKKDLTKKTISKEQRHYQTKDQSTEKVPVRLNHKTVVYVLPGYDIEALRAKYLK